MDRLVTAVVRVMFIDLSLGETGVGVDNDGAVPSIRRRVRERFSFEGRQISPDKSPGEMCRGHCEIRDKCPGVLGLLLA